MDIDKIVARLPSNKGKRRNPNRVRGRYRKKQRTLTDSDLIRHLIDNDLRTTGKLRAHRKAQPDSPTLYDYIKAFGSWRQAQTSAFGPPPPFTAPIKPSREYLAQCVNLFNLRHRQDWINARKTDSVTIPSLFWIRYHYGSFRCLVAQADKLSLSKQMDAYIALTLQLKKQPTVIQCRQNDIPISSLIKNLMCKDKRDLNQYVQQLIGKLKKDSR